MKPWHHCWWVQYAGHCTEMTLYPLTDRARHCLKNMSAVPEMGGMQTRGLLP